MEQPLALWHGHFRRCKEALSGPSERATRREGAFLRAPGGSQAVFFSEQSAWDAVHVLNYDDCKSRERLASFPFAAAIQARRKPPLGLCPLLQRPLGAKHLAELLKKPNCTPAGSQISPSFSFRPAPSPFREANGEAARLQTES